MTRLTDLDPTFVDRCSQDGHSFYEGAPIASAQGIMFDCPKCRRHSILAWFRDRNVPAAAEPAPARWAVSGSGFDDLTLFPSIDLSANPNGCQWHGHVTNGEAA
jgi:hypothetical protein